MLDSLPAAAQFLQRQAWAENSKATLKTESKAYFHYCSLARVNPIPADGPQLTLYATWLAASGRLRSADSIKQYVSAVSVIHKLEGKSCPTPSQYGPLDQVIRGFRRLAQRPVKKSLPVTPRILANLLSSKINNTQFGITHQQQILVVFRSFSLLLFQTMLRSSNMLAKGRHKVDQDRVLTWDKIHRIGDGDGIVMRFRKSKTIQNNERCQEIPLATSDNKLICPIFALDQLRAMYGPRSCTPGTPVFRLPTVSGGWSNMVVSDYIPFFLAHLSQMGLVAANYSLHGFRHGSVQETLLAEDNLALCQLVSDHASDAILGYANVPADRMLGISRCVNESLAANLPTLIA